MNILRKALAAATLAATALVTTTPAMAEHRDGRRGNDTAAIAVGVGIVGIALGAIIASNKRDRYNDRYYVRDGWYYNDGYYYNRQGHRHGRHDWERRYGHGYDGYRGHRGKHWNRGHRGQRGDWNRGHRGYRGDWNRGDHRRGHGDRYYDRRGY